MIKLLFIILFDASFFKELIGSEKSDYLNVVFRVNFFPNSRLEYKKHMNRILTIDKAYYNVKSLEINCSISKLKHPAKTVHELKPNDIKIIAALGDSITTAAAARAEKARNLVLEYSSISWSIGGQPDAITLPNLIKKFNPNLIGFSKKDTFWIFKNEIGYNLAMAGAKSKDLLLQARSLVKKLKRYENEWKLITIMIGGNDLCKYCENKKKFSAENYLKNLKDSLDLLHKELPKTFVNLVNTPNVIEFENLDVDSLCKEFHLAVCPCMSSHNKNKTEINDLFLKYSNYTEQLTMSGRYDTRNDFTVVYQPFYRDFKLPRLPDNSVDISYFAPDCFHFSLKSHGIINNKYFYYFFCSY